VRPERASITMLPLDTPYLAQLIGVRHNMATLRLENLDRELNLSNGPKNWFPVSV
jgi:hypothetical protein